LSYLECGHSGVARATLVGMEFDTLPSTRPNAPPLPNRGVGRFLFRSGASRQEKAFTLFALLWMALSVYGLSNSFVASSWWTWLAVYLAVPISLFFFIQIVLDRHPAIGFRRLGG
jgi:hypothetical protein